jgi:hypothetical protein
MVLGVDDDEGGRSDENLSSRGCCGSNGDAHGAGDRHRVR